jgi:predicted transcriptional regulator
MNALLKQAVDKVQSLPDAMQDEAARLLLAYAGEEAPSLALSPEEEADLREAFAEMQRGEFATDDEVEAVLSKYRV